MTFETLCCACIVQIECCSAVNEEYFWLHWMDAASLRPMATYVVAPRRAAQPHVASTKGNSYLTLSSSQSSMSTDEQSDVPPKPAVRLTIPERYYMLPGAAIIVGTTIGLFRGSRLASLRFLAENVHRPPTTVKGWYFYNKTKNYRMILGGLKQAGADAARLGTAAAGWVAIEEGCERLDWKDVSEVAAGLGTAAIFAGVCECCKGESFQDED